VRRLSGLLAAAALVSALVAGAAVAGSRTVSDGGTPAATVDTGSAIVQLNGDPLSTYVKTKPPAGKKIDFSSNTVKSYRAQLSALRNDFKQWLKANAPAANVTGQLDIALNAVAVQLNGTPLSVIRSAPQVKSADYEAYYTPQASLDPDLPLISAFAAWGGEGNGANAGKIAGTLNDRVKVGVIDTGIDVTHPCFNDAGFPATQKQGPPALTNNKVIVAKVFYNKANNQGLTPAPVQEHGTHVSGTIACDYGLTNSTTSVDGVTVPYGVLGVAPGAQLGNYNVFPGDVSNARSEDILDALEAAYTDGMDIINMSLGGNSHGVQDLLTNAVNDLDQAGMISAIAAGNSGPGHFTVESPGSAARGLTAGAFTVGHFIGAPVTAGGTTYGAAAGDFAKVTSDLTANLGAVSGTGANGLSTACSALPAGSLSGKIDADQPRHLYVLGEDPERAGGRCGRRARREQRRWRPDRDGPGRHAEPAYGSRLHAQPGRRWCGQGVRRQPRHDRRDVDVLPERRQLEHHGRLLEPGPDRRRLPRQAGRRLAGR